ncbi:MAG: FAD-dependent oxidoreductase [Gemmataceae bacterium]
MIRDALVIGGGFYGLYLAETLARRGERVMLCERGPRPMMRASYTNQARVHNGYHYPRSVLTALRSRVNFPRFADEFRPAIHDGFVKLYAIPRQGSKVTAEQFAESMRRIGAPIEVAANELKRLFDQSMVEEVFRVREAAFDSLELCRIIRERAERAGVEIRTGVNVDRVRGLPGDSIRVATADGEITAGMVLNCTYSQTNAVAAASGLPLIPLKHEIAEMALIEPPDELREVGVTVMDGPFFSCMPFPPRELHTLSHVRYTPHGHWTENDPQQLPAYRVFERFEKRSAFDHMLRDAARYLPVLAKCRYRDSLWDVKTVLPRSETDDSRPILFRPHHGIPNYHVVMGGKIDNVYDVADELTNVLNSRTMPLAA